jgi:hypothetical protein
MEGNAMKTTHVPADYGIPGALAYPGGGWEYPVFLVVASSE